MARSTPFVVAALAACAFAMPAQAQEAKGSESGSPIAIDAALVKTGKAKFSSKACSACHAIGKKMAGPDLNGVFERRSVDWLKSWLKDPNAMLATDETAKALLKEYKGVKMPNMKLTDADIEALLHYLASEQKPAK
jgi:mono/diheme cytochrome c family protein